MVKDMTYAVNYRHGAKRGHFYGPNIPYDWRRHGVISRVAPAFLMSSNNSILTKVMSFIDMWTVNLLMTIEKVQKFKNFTDK